MKKNPGYKWWWVETAPATQWLAQQLAGWTYICPRLLKYAENTFFTFLWFSNSSSVIHPKICPFIHPFFPKYAPASTPSSYCIRYRVIKYTGASHWTKTHWAVVQQCTITSRISVWHKIALYSIPWPLPMLVHSLVCPFWWFHIV